MEKTVVDILLVGLVSVAAYTDVRRGKVYNVLTFPSMAAGLAINGISGGIDGLAASVSAGALAVALLMVPVAMRGVGAGDLKLMVAVGMLEGTSFLLPAFFFSALILGATALGILGYRSLALVAMPAYARWGPGAVRALPFAVAVALGCFIVLSGATYGR